MVQSCILIKTLVSTLKWVLSLGEPDVHRQDTQVYTQESALPKHGSRNRYATSGKVMQVSANLLHRSRDVRVGAVVTQSLGQKSALGHP